MSNDASLLKNLCRPFPPSQIGRLPKPTKKQTEQVKADYRKGIRCAECGAWHHPDVVHLDYVGHAALTARLLETDLNWHWEPLGYDEFGLPALDKDGLLWIKLTVLGVTRIGCGDAGGKTGGDAMKERIGDALRNAGMRFGMALDLWHKGDQALFDEPAALDGGILDASPVEPAYTPEQKEAFDRIFASGNAAEFFVITKKMDAETHAALFNSFPTGKKTENKEKARALVSQGGAIVADWVETITQANGDDTHVKECCESNKPFVIEYIRDQLAPEAVAFFDEVRGGDSK